MKPKRIILVRHGESEGNVNKSFYLHTPDYAVPLTEKGQEQARQAGVKLHELIGRDEKEELFHHEGPFFYVSPYFRSRETFELIAEQFPYAIYREDIRLREQEWANNHQGSLELIEKLNKKRDEYGQLYFRLPNGESGADVYDRVSDFIASLHRDFERPDFPDTVIIIAHGLLNRLFLMRWFHMAVEDFEAIKNPDNGEFYVMERQRTGKYKLTEELKKYGSPTHAYQRPIRLPHPKTQKIALQREKE